MESFGVSRATPLVSSRRAVHVHVHASTRKVRMCTGKVCSKQGSKQVLKFAQDLGLEELDVKECGCLGNCGNGPNLVILPEGTTLRHVATPADMADVLAWQLNLDIPEVLIRATELRLAGNLLAVEGDLSGALVKYQEALDLSPARGAHMLHSNMSAAHLQAGNKEAALQHAQSAVSKAPKGFHMAHIRVIDAFYALGRYKEAAGAVKEAIAADPAFRSLPEFKVITQALAKVGAAVAG